MTVIHESRSGGEAARQIFFATMASSDAAREVKVVLLGDAGVGKSSLVLRFVTGSFDKYSEATIG